MKKVNYMFALFMVLCAIACANEDNLTTEKGILDEAFNDSTLVSIVEETNPNLIIKEGILCQHEQTIRILRNGVADAIVKLGEPVIVSQANMKVSWGYYQFPGICIEDDSTLVVKWQMKKDTPETYLLPHNGLNVMVSTDGGKTWVVPDKEYPERHSPRIALRNGDLLQAESIQKNVTEYAEFPDKMNETTIGDTDYYRYNDLPEELKGFYLSTWNKNSGFQKFHATMTNPTLLRSTYKDLMSIVFWGDMRMLPDGSIIAVIYPSCYQTPSGISSSVTFYKSTDEGKSWDYMSALVYPKSSENDEGYFEEPTFEILKDGSLVSILRTGNTTSMFKSSSIDGGKTWTTPAPFTPNGVAPVVKRLGNGTLVLTSGRPGTQIRFCLDEKGELWTEPIEMVPFMNTDGTYDLWGASCGYTSILPIDDNSFYMVYSDFKSKDENGEERKAIMFRTITIKRR